MLVLIHYAHRLHCVEYKPRQSQWQRTGNTHWKYVLERRLRIAWNCSVIHLNANLRIAVAVNFDSESWFVHLSLSQRSESRCEPEMWKTPFEALGNWVKPSDAASIINSALKLNWRMARCWLTDWWKDTLSETDERSSFTFSRRAF